MSADSDPNGRARSTRVEVYTRPGCHLCKDAIAVVRQVCAETQTGWVERDINDDPDWLRRFTDQVPVTHVDGKPHDFWRVDAGRLRTALAADRS